MYEDTLILGREERTYVPTPDGYKLTADSVKSIQRLENLGLFLQSSREDIAALTAEIRHLRKQRDELHAACNAELEKRRAAEAKVERLGKTIEATAQAQISAEDRVRELEADIANREYHLANHQKSVCSYCGEWTERAGRTREEFTAAIHDHMLSCEKRPEAQMLLAIMGMLKAIGAELPDASVGVDGLIDTFALAWNEFSQRAERAEAEVAEARNDTARLNWIINQSNAGNGWLGDDVWDESTTFSAEDDDPDAQAYIRKTIDAAMEATK